MCPHENTHVEEVEYDQLPGDAVHTQRQLICDDCGACVEVLDQEEDDYDGYNVGDV